MVNALIKISKLYLPFMETFLRKNIFVEEILQKKVFVIKNCDKNFCIKKSKIVKKKKKCQLKIRNQIVTKLKY